MGVAGIPDPKESLSASQAAVLWLGGDPRWRPSGDCAPLTRTVRADMCIVGGGFTGLWTAFWVKRLCRDAEVVLLEREFCASGASGRNGGWIHGWDLMLPTLISRFGVDSARWLLDTSMQGVDQTISEVVREGGIECDLALNGGLIVAMSPAQLDSLREPVAAAERVGRDGIVQVLSREEAQAASGSPYAAGGIRLPHCGTVQPALLVQGLRRLVIEAGVHVFEASPMTRLERGRPPVVETPAGTVIADQVVLACGSWLAQLRELRRSMFIVPSHIVATAPAGECLDAMGWRFGQPLADSRLAVHYAQRSADDRLVFGRAGGRLGFAGRIIPAHFHDKAECESIVSDLRRLLPDAGGLPIAWHWGGPIERTQHGTPWVGSIGPHGNVHYGVGYGGSALGPAQVMGRTLASVALRLDDEYASSPLVSDPPSYLPPEPVRSAGAWMVRAAVNRCEEQADRGLTPDPLSKALSRGLSFSVPTFSRTRRRH